MAVAWVQTVTAFGGATPKASGSFTPTAGNLILVAAFDVTTTNTTVSFSGTGTYSSITNFPFNDPNTDTWNANDNSSATAGSQTFTVSSTNAGDFIESWGWEYSGVSTLSGTNNQQNRPGTGTGAILGTSVSVATGAILIALCVDIDGSTAISSPGGTNRGSGTLLGSNSYCATEYSGSGGNIQPSFTSTNGSSDRFSISQFLLSPAATGGNPVWLWV